MYMDLKDMLIPGVNISNKLFTTPNSLEGSDEVILRLNWTYLTFEKVLKHSSKSIGQHKSDGGEFFLIQIPQCPKATNEQDKAAKLNRMGNVIINLLNQILCLLN